MLKVPVNGDRWFQCVVYSLHIETVFVIVRSGKMK